MVSTEIPHVSAYLLIATFGIIVVAPLEESVAKGAQCVGYVEKC